MYLFILRILVLFLGGGFGYLKISRDYIGLLYGLSIGLTAVVFEMILEKMHLYKKSKRVLVLDASALIDGRIADLCDNYFITDNIIVPTYVVQYLKSVSSKNENDIKKSRAKYGLEILERMKKNKKISIKVVNKRRNNKVDAHKQIADYAQAKKASLVTTDFGMGRYVSKKLKVLNINDLADLVKTILVPGEILRVFIGKAGKDRAQAVAYLDDGTMVVIEDGKIFIGKRVEVMIDNVIQTVNGRMVFSHVVDPLEV
ncbi:MAG: TRAM domain-containing protein [Elusimicrobiota bacterium]